LTALAVNHFFNVWYSDVKMDETAFNGLKAERKIGFISFQ
jgi:hypothetical protein